MSRQLDRLIIEGLLFSGLRTTKFCRLTLADTVIGRRRSVFVVSGLKGRDRTVWVPSEVSRLVEQFAAETRPALLPAEVDPNDSTKPLVFGERKNPLERTGLYRRVVRVLRAAGLGDRASVQLRHTYGYLAYTRSGGNLLFVQRQQWRYNRYNPSTRQRAPRRALAGVVAACPDMVPECFNCSILLLLGGQF